MYRNRGLLGRRLELAREVSNSDSELDRLLHHRKVRIVSGAESVEIDHLDKLIARLRIAEEQSASKEQESVVEPEKIPNNEENEPVSLKTVNPSEEEHVNKEENASALIKSVKPGEEKHATDLLSLSDEVSAGVGKKLAPGPVVYRFKALAQKLRIPKHLMDPDSSTKDKSFGSANDKGTSLPSSEVDMDSLPNRNSRVRRSHFLCNDAAPNDETAFDNDINDLTMKMDQWSLSECICDRNVKRTQCTACGEILDGRVFRRCKNHPRDIVYFLKDLFYCPKCEADIAELREIEEET